MHKSMVCSTVVLAAGLTIVAATSVNWTHRANLSDESQVDCAHCAEWAARLSHPDPDVRNSARRKLIREGERAVPLLIALLEEPDREVRYEAIGALCRNRSAKAAVVPGLIRLLQKGDPEVNCMVIETLSNIGPDAAAAVPELQRLFREKRTGCSFILLSLARIQGEDAVPFLIEMLDTDWHDVAALALDYVRLQGTWVMTSTETNGRSTVSDTRIEWSIHGNRWNGGRWTKRSPNGETSGGWYVNCSQTPRWMRVDSSNADALSVFLIYDLNASTLSICQTELDTEPIQSGLMIETPGRPGPCVTHWKRADTTGNGSAKLRGENP